MLHINPIMDNQCVQTANSMEHRWDRGEGQFP